MGLSNEVLYFRIDDEAIEEVSDVLDVATGSRPVVEAPRNVGRRSSRRKLEVFMLAFPELGCVMGW